MKISRVFNLPVSANWAQAQTRRVQLDAETAGGAVTVNLPTVESVQEANASGVEIYVNDFDANAGVNNITVVSNAGAGDLINGGVSVVVNINADSFILKVAGDGSWTAL